MKSIIEPGPTLYRHVRAKLALRGHSLSSWCRQHSMTREWVYACLMGRATGRRATATAARVRRLLGLA